MDTFPLLSKGPSYPVGEQIETNAIKSSFEYGHVRGRKRYTTSRITFWVEYRSLSDADKSTLIDFIELVNTALEFEWTHPIAAVTYICRFKKVPKLQCVAYQLWNTSLELLTVKTA
jgi:hypothetical protein